MPGLPPPRPIPLKDRASILFLEKGQLDVLDGAFEQFSIDMFFHRQRQPAHSLRSHCAISFSWFQGRL